MTTTEFNLYRLLQRHPHRAVNVVDNGNLAISIIL